MMFLPHIHRQIILASASPRRQDLLKHMGIPFIALPSNVDETPVEGLCPKDLACLLALRKAENVANHVNAPCLVIAADTVVYKKRLFGKPKDEPEAIRMLTELQGGRHQVFTGLVLLDSVAGYQRSAYEETSVEMTPLTNAQITAYVASGESMDKAGAYAIQGWAAAYIVKIHGCYFNVVGLPLHRLWCMLQDYVKVLGL